MEEEEEESIGGAGGKGSPAKFSIGLFFLVASGSSASSESSLLLSFTTGLDQGRDGKADGGPTGTVDGRAAEEEAGGIACPWK